MNKKDKGVDYLTRELLQSAMLKPSDDLSRRIMERILQEEPLHSSQPQVVHVKKWRISPWIMLLGTLYFVAMLAFLYVMQSGGGAMSIDLSKLAELKGLLPYLLTAVILFFALPFFRTVDEALS